jgi:hypothetical protein
MAIKEEASDEISVYNLLRRPPRFYIALFCNMRDASTSGRDCFDKGWEALTLALIIDTALGFRLELGLDLVQQIVEPLGRTDRGTTSHDAGRVVVHGRVCMGSCTWAIIDGRVYALSVCDGRVDACRSQG